MIDFRGLLLALIIAVVVAVIFWTSAVDFFRELVLRFL